MTSFLSALFFHSNEKNSLPKNRFRVDKETMDIAVKYKTEALMPPKFSLNIIMPGDIITVRDILYAMMLPSNNESAFYFASFIADKYYR